jgi:hypothetical protein
LVKRTYSPHLPAQGAVNRRREALAQLLDRPVGEAGHLRVHRVAALEGVLRAEDLLVEEGHQSEELQQLVLQRRGGEEQLRPLAKRVPEGPGDLAPRPVRVPQPMGLVDDHQVPGKLPDLLGAARGEGVAGDDRHRLLEGVVPRAPAAAVDDRRLQLELVPELRLPLRAQGGGGEHEDPSLSLGHQLGEDDAGLDVFPSPTSSASMQPPRGSDPSANAAAST